MIWRLLMAYYFFEKSAKYLLRMDQEFCHLPIMRIFMHSSIREFGFRWLFFHEVLIIWYYPCYIVGFVDIQLTEKGYVMWHILLDFKNLFWSIKLMFIWRNKWKLIWDGWYMCTFFELFLYVGLLNFGALRFPRLLSIHFQST